ncbi:acetyl-CoA carboxylase biotin carboxylase subunit [Micromonospora globispora]|uniref:acetyl-CoA carboxylase biotin carboxylase subunit n=1 Tax=Micromonospora globispora TaxID=1450148 RepID=UPI000D704B7C|nr:biotin carboxylase N-terminal domain-containing protein [Micromonospora globispora]PWU55446.1 acetyl-CoA carboxylase biotin carboxylase subunit [Micromonospora globispora]RQW91845.1 acetyl-CoA carboxylase biotin carboxylase subunit [Micromonospora globispora]
MTHRVFVANRGEIAVRIIEACDRLGFETVLGVSAADRDTLAARRAGRVVVLGGPRPVDSYLALGTVAQAAVSTGCTAVHPGYGFLSERAEFARLCAENGLVFVGPAPAALEALGDKLSARELATSLGVPVSPGGTARSVDEVQALAERTGFPVLIKAAHGGGGRGMKLVASPGGLAEAWSVASAEAQSAFGDGSVFLERFVHDAKHVEVQIIGDRHGNRIHLGERECSVQYRYQKLVEEAPCAVLSAQTRRLLHDSALRIAGALDYVGLGTVEFLYDPARDEVAFLEVNPRLQVEHPVTEAVTGVDLVREQLLVALGEPLTITQDDVRLTGHAVECRITAQDPTRALHPTPGTVKVWRPPVGGAIRLDSHIYEGYRFPPFYDALMGKLITWGPDRAAAVGRMGAALDRFEIGGITTSLGLLRQIVGHNDYADNTVTTHWLGDVLLSEGSQA